jgi:UDPglucose 6-dehydrogenase
MKYACNCFLAMKLSYVNAIASICESVGADVEQLCAGLASDSRIGARFLSPGLGFGGSGFSKDLSALERIAERSGYDFQLVKEVSRINDAQVSRFLNKIRKTLWTLRGKQVAVLGLAYKGGTDDLRGSPAIKIVSSLLKEGCRIAAHDPAAMGAAAEVLDGLPVSFHRSPYDAARGSDALIILTDWPDFAELDLDRLRKTLSLPIVIDGRNLYTPERMREHGLLYTSVGRPTAAFEVPELARGASNGRR